MQRLIYAISGYLTKAEHLLKTSIPEARLSYDPPNNKIVITVPDGAQDKAVKFANEFNERCGELLNGFAIVTDISLNCTALVHR